MLRKEPLITTWVGLLWGLLQGVRHACEPDHLAAVSTLVAERRSPRSAASYAAAWGLGHAVVLVVVGGVLLVLRAGMPSRIAAAFEVLVSAMLVVLGARALRRSLARAPSPSPDGHVHAHALTLPRQPLVVGCVHGLAGSGALAAVVASQLRSAAAGLLYICVYGGGAALGMAILAGVAGVPLARMARTGRGQPALLAATGSLSLVLGLAWGWSALRAP